MVEIKIKANTKLLEWSNGADILSLTSSRGPLRMFQHPHIWHPPTDVYETDQAVIVRVEIAGMHEEDFSIYLAGKYLVIRGQRPDIPEKRAYHRMEIFFGEFMTDVELPCPVNPEGVEAEYSSGFLKLVIPKETPLRIQIKDG